MCWQGCEVTDTHTSTVAMWKVITTLNNRSTISCKVTSTLTIQPRSFTLQYIPKRTECLCPQKYLYKNVRHSFISKSHNWKQSR